MSTNIRNAADYAAYQESVADFLKDFDGEPSSGYWTCPECNSEEWSNTEHCPECDADPEMYSEPHFSWSGCDCCRGTLGGDREHVIGWLKGASEGDAAYSDAYQWEGNICPNCIYYLAYGRLDDMTMIQIENE